MKKIQVNKKTFILIVSLIVLLLTFYFISKIDTSNKMEGKITQNEGEIEWKKYSNKKYNFEIQFPSYWHVSEDFSGPSPIINFYQRVVGQNPPFNHFSEISHVSIYPDGIPTEGIIGDQQDITEKVISSDHELVLQEQPSKVISFVLVGGTSWATMINFENVPDSWSDWGFLWSRGRVSNYKEKCFRNDEEISIFECDVFGGDEIRRFGSVNQEIKNIQESMINSFKFNE